MVNQRQKLRAKAIAYKGGKCELCGYNRCPAALEFHHLDPMTKDFDIGSNLTSFAAIRAELDKCILVCATCHREVHDGWHPNYIQCADNHRSDYDW